jgi:NAD(P)-dependent dehydrogenase (short-subunit alcohol dehydrogenase family)
MSGGGHIVNTASMAGLYPGFAAPYDASKHAVVAITEGLYHSLRDAQMPVGVSCLCPGWVRTGILDADRNWPAEYGAVPEVDAAAEIARTYVRRAIDEGTQPAAIADHVLDAVRDGRYWVLPHPEFVDMAMERFAQIGEGANPERPEHTPGMPPRSQVLAEVMAAMAASEDTPPTVPHDSPPTVPPA